MITNDQVQRLIACDREALVDLVALAWRQGRRGYALCGEMRDVDIAELLRDAEASAWPDERAERRALARWRAWAAGES